MKLLLGYAWPGNVRELENAIEHAVVLAEGERIEGANLPARLREIQDPVHLALAGSDLSVKRAFRIVEEDLIRKALHASGGNRTTAARVLDLSYRALLYKIKEYNILDQ